MLRILRHYLLLAAFFLRGRHFRLARRRASSPPADWHLVLEEEQPIHATEFAEGKIANMRRAVAEIEGLVIPPGGWFSWWHFIPHPAAKNGFALGRTLVGGQLTAGYGGGLCQLSGIIYLAALKLCMTIHERHAHSQDIYREDERYAPLGSDAAIVFGHKNLVFRNTTSHTFMWTFQVQQHALLLRVYAKANFAPARIMFRKETTNSHEPTAITTLRQHGETTETISYTVYPRKTHDESH